jgi:hypothetical protein
LKAGAGVAFVTAAPPDNTGKKQEPAGRGPRKTSAFDRGGGEITGEEQEAGMVNALQTADNCFNNIKRTPEHIINSG